MPTQTPPPSVESDDFACPHCGAHAHQFWYEVRVDEITDPQGKPSLPYVPTEDSVAKLRGELASGSLDKTNRQFVESILQEQLRLIQGFPYLDQDSRSLSLRQLLRNVFASRCHSCDRIAIWIHDRLIYPPQQYGPSPNEDLPADALQDYREASSILPLSPRGAAALLRLAIEKLCCHVGAQGANLDAMIGWLVQNGLPKRVQQALDAVRVIGNNAVHPGAIDLRDDSTTARKLFDLVNIIAEKMLTEPRKIDALFDKVPPGAKAAIVKRDGGS